MSDSPESKYWPVRLFRMLVEARWFFTFTSSLCATVIGITLTFGINAYREAKRTKREMQKSMLQAVDNLKERFEDAEDWVNIIQTQDSIYNVADSLYRIGAVIPDSVCEEFRYTMPYIRIASFDHDFEKIFRGSYQIWQLQSRNDSLVFYIGHCYDCLNLVENTCEKLTEGMLEQIGIVNNTKGFYRDEPRQWTMALLSDPRFQYYMSVRKVKALVATDVFRQALADYETNVLSRSESLRNQ